MSIRIFDLFIAIIGLIILAPFFPIAALAIKLDSAGPIFYRGERVGRHGIVFGMIKLRSMIENADQLGSALTTGHDSRVTRVGAHLRKWKIDEFPQLINVLRGEMSLVGPRPESPAFVRFYSDHERGVLAVRPGITGPAQIQFRHEEKILDQYPEADRDYVEIIMPGKLILDLNYIQDRSLSLNIKLIVQTLLCLFKRENQPSPIAIVPSDARKHPPAGERIEKAHEN